MSNQKIILNQTSYILISKFDTSNIIFDKNNIENINFPKMWDLHPQEPAEVMILGKLIKTPRYQQSYLNDYTFSGLSHKALNPPQIFLDLLNYVNTHYTKDVKFNQIFYLIINIIK